MQHISINQYLRNHIRTVPDWPAPGVQFRDITPLLQDPKVFRVLIDAFVHRYMDKALRPDVVAGLDARGFILGAVVAYELNVGFVPIRKKGKLPFTTVEETYELEYGSATVELHTDAVKPGDRVVVPFVIACGACYFCERTLFSACETTNSGPGTACAAPYPARNWASVTHPGGTTSARSSGSTVCPPPNTSEPAR